MAVLRERSMMQGAWEEGWEEGLEKGMKEGLEEVRKEIAIKAIAMKIPTSQIERLTGLTRAEIEDLRR
jgi:predicted transposase/invertase (TIGR01784 family)